LIIEFGQEVFQSSERCEFSYILIQSCYIKRKIMKKIIFPIISIFILIIISFCGSPDRTNPKDPKSNLFEEPPRPNFVLTIQTSKASVVLGNSELIFIFFTLKQDEMDISENIDASNFEYEITRSDDSGNANVVLSINNSGEITPLSPGQADIKTFLYYKNQKIISNTVTFEVLENNAGIIVEPSGVSITEGQGAASVELSLNAAPLADVTFDLSQTKITLLGSPPSAPCFNTSLEELVINPVEIVFTDENYSEPQSINISYPDNDCIHYTMFFRIELPKAISSDTFYDDMSAIAVTASVIEDYTNDSIPIAIPIRPYEDQQDYEPNSSYIKIHFTKPMESSTINDSTIIVENNLGLPISGYVSYQNSTQNAFFYFTNYLVPKSEYTVRLLNDIRDIYSNYFNEDIEYSYTFQNKYWTYPFIGTYNTGGAARGIFKSGNYVYVADYDSGFDIVDVTDPASPFLEIGLGMPDLTWGVVVDGNYAYVATGTDGGLQIFDVTDPTDPIFEGEYDTPSSARGVDVSGGFAYIADYASGLQIIDLTDTANPSFEGSYDTPNFAFGVRVYGNYAYVADTLSGLQIIDVTDPANPSFVGNYDTPGSAYDVVVSGNYAYVADYEEGLQIIDITDPGNPSFAGEFNTADEAQGIAFSNNNIYLADKNSGLEIIDVTDPVNPYPEGHYDVPGKAYAVLISDNYAYIASWTSGFQIIDITDKSNFPVLAGYYDTPDEANDVAISGQYAYVADGDTGLQIIDITDPSNPLFVGNYTMLSAYRVTISGNYAYMGTGDSGLQIIDITNPVNPSFVGSYEALTSVGRVILSGNYAYLAAGNSGIHIIDITDPSDPSYVGNYDTPGYAKGIAVNGNYAYIADGSVTGLQILDVTDPADSSYVNDYDTPGSCLDVVLRDNYIYIADGSIGGMQILDITDPANPFYVGDYDTPGSAGDIVLRGNYAYIADTLSGLQIIDITDPVNPAFVGEHITQDGTNNVAISSSYAYTAEGTSGLQIIFLGPWQTQ